MKTKIILTITLCILSVGLYVACSDEEPEFLSVTPDLSINLPADHAAHPDYKTEWWYYTGHLKGENGKKYGFQLTWFRVGLTPEEQRESKFGSGTFYFAHFGLTEKDDETFRHAEAISRGGEFDNAGADARVLRTWIGDWKVERLGDMFYMSARTDTMGLSLIATPEKPVVLQGKNGYSQKGASPTNASMYYSYTRLSVAGILEIEGQPVRVEGQAWMDHEYGTSQLDENQVGWDWFSLQLDNNEEIMVYGLRQEDGSFSPNATGAYILADGTKVPLALKDYTIDVLETWKSPVSGGTYPSKWRITIPSQNMEAVVSPYVANQEMQTENSARVTYWEGAVSIDATKDGEKIAGEGYVEMTGYANKLTSLQ